MPYLMNLVYLVALIAAAPYLVYKAITAGKYRRGMLSKFFGLAMLRDSDKPCVWFHGVSVGEIHLLRQLVLRFGRRHADWECVISTTTDTGYDEACKHFPDLHVFFWPFDFTWAVRRSLRRVKPSLVVLAEGELWPNFLTVAEARGVPVAVVNGRLSPRSLWRWRRLAPLIAPMLTQLELLAVQTEEYAIGFRTLGATADQVKVTGSVKFDGVAVDRQNDRTRELRTLFAIQPDDLVLIAGSTQAPEEHLIIELCRQLQVDEPRLRVVLVPRQRERFDDVARLLSKAGLPFVRRSELTNPVEDRAAFILLDTIGELAAAWGLADVAFVGGSLDGRRGGQNMIEPAAYGAAVVFGPHVWNFRETAAKLREGGAALQVRDAAELAVTIRRLMKDPGERRRLGHEAQAFVQAQQGATDRTIALLDRLLVHLDSNRRAA